MYSSWLFSSSPLEMASQNTFHIVWFQGPQSILDKLSFVFSCRFAEKDGCLASIDLLTRAITIAVQDVKNFLALMLVSSTKKETSSARRRWVSLKPFRPRVKPLNYPELPLERWGHVNLQYTTKKKKGESGSSCLMPRVG